MCEVLGAVEILKLWIRKYWLPSIYDSTLLIWAQNFLGLWQFNLDNHGEFIINPLTIRFAGGYQVSLLQKY